MKNIKECYICDNIEYNQDLNRFDCVKKNIEIENCYASLCHSRECSDYKLNKIYEEDLFKYTL